MCVCLYAYVMRVRVCVCVCLFVCVVAAHERLGRRVLRARVLWDKKIFRLIYGAGARTRAQFARAALCARSHPALHIHICIYINLCPRQTRDIYHRDRVLIHLLPLRVPHRLYHSLSRSLSLSFALPFALSLFLARSLSLFHSFSLSLRRLLSLLLILPLSLSRTIYKNDGS